jgi:hypothetical protein
MRNVVGTHPASSSGVSGCGRREPAVRVLCRERFNYEKTKSCS